MIRIAIIGNSHVGALREAKSAIKAAYPTLELSYFALARHRFNAANYGEDGILRADIADESERASVLKINGITSIDLRSFTHILVVGQGFLLKGLYPLIAQHNILGLTETAQARSISLGLLREAAVQRIRGVGNRLAQRFREDPRFVIAQMPYPCAQIDPQIDPGHAATAAHPDAAQLYEIIQSIIAQQMARHPLGYLAAPAPLAAAPFQTKAQYARAYALPSGHVSEQAPEPGDYTHMNSDYGFELFKVFANQWLGLAPLKSPQTEKV